MGNDINEELNDIDKISREDDNGDAGSGNISDMKKGTKLLIVLVILFLYGLVSCGLLVSDHFREKEYNLYSMGIGNTTPSIIIDKTVHYRQYFYTPRRTNGLNILFATYNTVPEKDIYISVYDAETDEKLGTEKINHEDIIDNEYTMVIFDGFRLEEGKHFYFEVFSKSNNPDSVCFWMGPNTTSPYADLLLQDGEELTGMGICFALCYEYNGKGLITWIFISVICALILNAVVVRLYGDELIRYQVGAVIVQMLMIVMLLWGYAHFIM